MQLDLQAIKCQKKRQNIRANVSCDFPQLSCFDKYLLWCHLLESHDFTKRKKNKTTWSIKIYSLYCWSKLLFSHFFLKSFISQWPWYLPLYLLFYHSYWKHGNYCEILKLHASFWLHVRDRAGALSLHKLFISSTVSRRRQFHLKWKITEIGVRGSWRELQEGLG